MDIKPIRTEAEYDTALRDIERYFENEPAFGSPEADRFDLLALVISDYEAKRWAVDLPEPIEAIKFRMEQGGFTSADLAKILGSRSRASEIMNRKRRLNLDMIRRLNQAWGIPVECLIQSYEIRAV